MSTNGEKQEDWSAAKQSRLIDYVTDRSTKVRTRRAGEVMACCILPGHEDKNPSMHVTEFFFHCFGCGRGGDIVTLVMLCEGLGFGEACNRIADEYGEGALPERIQAKRAAFRAQKVRA
jgi:DNA primase